MGLKGFEKLNMKGARVLTTRLPADGPAPHPEAGGDAGPGRRHEFTVWDWRPPALNQLMRGKIRTRIRLGKRGREAIDSALFEACVPFARGKRRVSLAITLTPRQREYDVDAPWKAVLDGLKHSGAILDDTVEWCEIGALTFTHGGQIRTTIVLEDL